MISTQKNLNMLNFGTLKLDQILNMGQSSGNGLGYMGITNTIAKMSIIVFVKVAAKTENTYIPCENSNVLPSKGKKK